MSFKKEFIFPFLTHRTYFESYAWSVALTIRMKSTLQVFTTTHGIDCNLDSTASIYHSLLEAQGYYLQKYFHRGIRSNVLREPCIESGELEEKLIAHLRQKPNEVVILHPGILSENRILLDMIVDEAYGVIILSEQPAAGEDEPHKDPFFDRLHAVQLINLPRNFLTTPGTEHNIFNFFRNSF